MRICGIEEKIFAAIFDCHSSLVNQLIFVSMFRDVCTCDITKRFTIQKVQCNFWLRISGEVLDEVDGLVWFQLHVFCEIRSGCVVAFCDALNGFFYLKKLPSIILIVKRLQKCVEYSIMDNKYCDKIFIWRLINETRRYYI